MALMGKVEEFQENDSWIEYTERQQRAWRSMLEQPLRLLAKKRSRKSAKETQHRRNSK